MSKRIVFFCCVLFASLGAQAGVKIEHWTASTGAKVYFVQADGLPILDVQVDFPAGSARDPAGKSGVASLTGQLLNTGAAGLDEEAIAARQVALAASLSAGSGDDSTSVRLRTLTEADKKEGALALMQAVLAHPEFPQEVLTREKARSIAALEDAETRPDYIAGKAFGAALYPGHPYGVNTSVADIERITRADVQNFYRSYFHAKGAIVSLIGAISRSEAERIAERLTRDLPAGEAPPPLPPVMLPKPALIEIEHPAQQAHIYIGTPAVKRSDPDYYALLVGNYSLGGGGFVSRLMKEVREQRGYAYSIYSVFQPKVLEGPFQIGLETKREQSRAALALVNDILAQYIAAGPSEAELKAAKRNIVDGLALRTDSNAKLLGFIAAIGFYDLPLTYLDDYPKLINSITAAQVRAAFQKHVRPEHLVTVVVAGGAPAATKKPQGEQGKPAQE